jgi:hypothetical protein
MRMSRGEELVPDATMADTGMSAIKQPLREWLRNMRTWRTFGVAGVAWWPGGDADGDEAVSSHFPAMPVVTGFPARIHG